jgi:hypothetical protein
VINHDTVARYVLNSLVKDDGTQVTGLCPSLSHEIAQGAADDYVAKHPRFQSAHDEAYSVARVILAVYFHRSDFLGDY